MSSTHCLSKTRQSRQQRLAIRRATVPQLSQIEQQKQNLFDAVNAQEYDQVLDLLQSGADPRISDKHARTPLHVASTKLDAAIVKALIDHGADVNAQDCIGNTPLHLACISGRVGIVGVLLRAGANLSSTECRSTPLSLALGRLQSMMNEKQTISSSTAKAEILDLIRMLKSRTSTINIENRYLMPPKKSDSSKKTLYLIRHGQSIANRDYDESEAYRDAGLTNQGIAQARALQHELERLNIELAVVSPLTRALQTCENALPSSYTGPVIVLPEIAEACSSFYSCGQKRSVIERKFPDRFDWSNISSDEIWWWPYEQKHQAEKTAVTQKRMEKFREFIRNRPEQRIAVFSHGDYLWEFLGGSHPYLANCQIASYQI